MGLPEPGPPLQPKLHSKIAASLLSRCGPEEEACRPGRRLAPGLGEGEMVKFLSNGPADHQFLVKAEMLKFLCALLAAPASPFLAMDTFCNSAIRWVALGLLRLLERYLSRTLDGCRPSGVQPASTVFFQPAAPSLAVDPPPG